MKKIWLILGACLALAFADLACAAGAVVTSLTGDVQAQEGGGTSRSLRLGDQVVQGQTIVTGASSSVVLRFDDGQIAALTANSRMQVSDYSYDPPSQRGNVLLSLVRGGMRVLTGLIGHNQPDRVRFRAATATIGIRGSEGNIVTDGNDVAVTVSDGAFTFTYGGQTIVIPAGAGVFGENGRATQGTAREIFDRLPPDFQRAIGGLDGLVNAINNARDDRNNTAPPGPPPGTPGPNVPQSNSGGGSSR
jgi:hypothetical protein